MILLLCQALFCRAYAQQIGPTNFNHPGGVVELFVPKTSANLPLVRFGIREPIIIEENDHWRILVGISLATVPGKYLVYVKQLDEPAFNLDFDVEPNSPAVKINTIDEGGSVYKTKHRKFSELDYSNTVAPVLPMNYPVNGQWSELFGQIIIDKQSNLVAQNYVSLTTTKLDNVTAPQNGIISRIEIDESNSELATLFVDHGRGLYSVISGVSDLTVETGNGVVAGAVLGKMPLIKNGSPATLIWQCVINGVYVNPLILTKI